MVGVADEGGLRWSLVVSSDGPTMLFLGKREMGSSRERSESMF